MHPDPRVDAHIAKRQPFAQPILERVREIVHRALPDVEKGIKWGVPHFMIGGKTVAGMAVKQHAAMRRDYLEWITEAKQDAPRARAWPLRSSGYPKASGATGNTIVSARTRCRRSCRSLARPAAGRFST